MRAERSAAGRGYPSPRAGSSATRGRESARSGRERERQVRSGSRPPARRGPVPRDAGRSTSGASAESRRTAPPVEGKRPTSTPDSEPGAPPAPESGFRGALAVLGVFLLTLAAAAADSYLGQGLGTITLVALTAGTVVATLMVRRRDLLSVLVAPPLVFVAVALINVGLAPSASLNLPTLATLLVRGFPAMAIATFAAVLVALFRWRTRR